MFEFTHNTKQSLINAGWYPERYVNIDFYKERLLEDNYKIFQKVEQFLHQYGGVSIKFQLLNGAADVLHFNAAKATGDVDPLWAQDDYYNRLGGKELCVIGQAYTDHMTVMMDEGGNVYGGFDDYLGFVARSGEEAIEAICSLIPIKEIK
nr:SUKH-3 domain-containing protein [uncultured Mucilaginibacter sp.]